MENKAWVEPTHVRNTHALFILNATPTYQDAPFPPSLTATPFFLNWEREKKHQNLILMISQYPIIPDVLDTN